MKFFIYLCVFLIPYHHLSSHQHSQLCSGFFPTNDMYIPVTSDQDNQSGISKEEFDDALDRIERVYSKTFTDLGKNLKLVREWENGTVNANAAIRGDYWQIRMFGGMARHELASFESFISVACHEIGHFLGGLPSRNYFNRTMSAEGQADYFATTKCMRKLFTHQENKEYIDSQQLHPYPKMICDLMFKQENNIDRLANCYRSSQAGFDQAMIYRAVKRGKENYYPVNWDTPTAKEVRSRSMTGHAVPQCRLDTYLRGAACPIMHDIDFDLTRTDLQQGACHREMTNEDFHSRLDEIQTEIISAKNMPEHINARPLCWYKPGHGGWK